MENLLKSKFLIFGFFRLLVTAIQSLTISSTSLTSEVEQLKSQRLDDLRLIADLTDRINTLTERLESPIVLPALTESESRPKSLVRHPSQIMDSIRDSYFNESRNE